MAWLASFVALHRGIPGPAHTDPDRCPSVDVEERPDLPRR